MSEENIIRCKLCNRPLKSILSIEREYGMGCYKKINPNPIKKKKIKEGYFK